MLRVFSHLRTQMVIEKLGSYYRWGPLRQQCQACVQAHGLGFFCDRRCSLRCCQGTTSTHQCDGSSPNETRSSSRASRYSHSAASVAGDSSGQLLIVSHWQKMRVWACLAVLQIRRNPRDNDESGMRGKACWLGLMVYSRRRRRVGDRRCRTPRDEICRGDDIQTSYPSTSSQLAHPKRLDSRTHVRPLVGLAAWPL